MISPLKLDQKGGELESVWPSGWDQIGPIISNTGSNALQLGYYGDPYGPVRGSWSPKTVPLSSPPPAIARRIIEEEERRSSQLFILYLAMEYVSYSLSSSLQWSRQYTVVSPKVYTPWFWLYPPPALPSVSPKLLYLLPCIMGHFDRTRLLAYIY